MDIYISADIEGVTGVVTWKQCGSPSSEHYDWQFARKMMTHDVNAAIRGARKAGAQRIVVKDSHNVSLNLLICDLEPGVELISGSGAGDDGMMEGIDTSFGAAFLVGYHARAGTPCGIMEHTITGRVHRFLINGVEAGEQMLSAFTAWHYGVPLALVTSDDKGCAEAMSFADGVVTACTKYGLGRFMGRLMHPSETGPAIESAAELAVRAAQSGSVMAQAVPSFFELLLEGNRSEEMDLVDQLSGWERLDGYTARWVGEDWPSAHTAARRAMSTMLAAG